MNAPRHIGDMGEALLRQKSGHLHAAATVVAKAGDGLFGVQLGQPCRHQAHGNVKKCKVFSTHTGGLQFPSLTNIQNHGWALGLLGLHPILELGRLDLVNHGVQNLKCEVLLKLSSAGTAVSHKARLCHCWSATRVNKVACMMGSSPTMAMSLPPTFS